MGGQLDHLFVPVEQSVPQLDGRHRQHWLRLTLVNNSDQTRWHVHVDYPHLRSLGVYSEQADTTFLHYPLGYQHLDKKNHALSGFMATLSLPKHRTSRLYLAVETDSPVIVPVHLRTDADLGIQTRLFSTLQGLFYGTFLVMTCFNVFIYFTTRDKSYLYYVLYIGSILVFTLSHDGLLREFIYPNHPFLASYNFHMMTATAPILFGSYFCRHFLNTRYVLPVYDLLFKCITGLCLLNFIILALYSHNPVPHSVMILTPAFALIALSAGLHSLITHQQTARFFVIAWLALICGSLAWIMTLLDILPYNTFTYFSVHLGAALETVLLSMALGDRIKSLEKEKLAIEQAAKVQLEDANKALAKSNTFKDEFLSTISHELRTPMNGIAGATELLEFTRLSEEQANYVSTIIRSSRDMMAMVDDILTFTQSEAGTLTAKQEDVDLHVMIRQLLTLYRGRAAQKQIGFHLQIGEPLPARICTDRQKLRLLLEHLIDNAIKFTDQGRVDVSITVKAMTAGDSAELCCTVLDTGCGIPFEFQQDLFQSFRQADGSMTRPKGGLGIGLALCKRIAGLLNASIDISSVPDSGTRVALRVPVGVPDTNEMPDNPAKDEQSNHRTARLLVVEDNPVNQLVLQTLLSKLGNEVFTARHGGEAVTLLDQQPIDLVFMDCQMPVMDGYEATRLIRSAGNANRQLPIIAVTANVAANDRQRCLDVGMNDYIKKPISQRIILEKLQRWLP